MEQEDWESPQPCAGCGASIAPESQRGFGVGVGNLLCFRCATERGGRYDAERDTWIVPPDVGDLPDEAYGAAPHEVRERRG